MARAFAGAQRINGALTLSNADPYTLSIMVRSTSTTARQQAIGVVVVAAADTGSTIELCGDVGGDPIRQRFSAGSGAAVATSLSAYVANTWYSCQARCVAGNDHSIFKDGVEGTSSTNIGIASNTSVVLGADVSSSSYSDFLNGQSASAAVWNAALNADEINSLVKGFSPRRVRPQSLKFYAPLVRGIFDWRQGITLTDTGTTTVADHPRAYGM